MEPSVQQNFYFASNMGTFFFKVRNDTKLQVKELNCNWIKIPIQKNFAVKSSIWIYPFSVKQSDKVFFIGILLWAPLSGPKNQELAKCSMQMIKNADSLN